ncbi:alpha-hydroxy acid oxidase [Microvirga lotononidis]|uniref:Alpha-hydroxyacid dehydrogenase, FMN-dependent L-lactate dehydrogenase n=1 Tax=Microvirga lotononidis TaxID=864069 RepID=I4YUF1_9HYPH|nr:alpha-hydroxy acid oxidase [Microvirga lotononidis]EIM27593.1 alpha-hydroxyacid dehydrogenase, FMN-dependent L-lactate dehydrogenase [Microvirga lotononidis]WQO28261.1 alpha-hydroxy acid oxidase [Microvirga lotononidis]
MTLPFESAAREKLGDPLFSYLLGRQGEQATGADANQEALAPYRLVPHVLTGANGISTETNLLEQTFAAPLAVGAFAGDRIFHAEGILPLARACAKARLPLIVSEETVTPLSEITQVWPQSWFQVRAAGPVRRTFDLIDLAARCGVKTVVMTVLAPTHPRPGLQPGGYSIAAEIKARGWTTIGSDGPGVMALPSFPQWSHADFTSVVAHASRGGIQVVAKGILSTGDAHRVREAGCGAIMVSNIGLRQTGEWIRSSDALQEMAGQVAQVPLLLDGGVRRGTDVIKSLCLGASMAVAVRPFVTALAAAGQSGVEEVIQAWLDEIAAVSAWMGVERTHDLDRSHLYCERDSR